MVLLNLHRATCTRCKADRHATEFRPNAQKHNGLQSHCIPCMNRSSDEWRRGHPSEANRMRAEYQKALKSRVMLKFGCRCAICDNRDERVLQIDHVNEDGAHERRAMSRGRVALYQKILRDTEARYQLLCANCHAIKTHGARARMKVDNVSYG